MPALFFFYCRQDGGATIVTICSGGVWPPVFKEAEKPTLTEPAGRWRYDCEKPTAQKSCRGYIPTHYIRTSNLDGDE